MVLAILAGCGAEGQEVTEAPPPPQVDVVRVQAQEVVLWDSFTGRLAAPESVQLRPRVSGYIERVEFVEGELVKEGDLLFVIDPRPYKAREMAAQAELARARSHFQLASNEAERAEQLWQGRAISREEFEQRAAAVTAARAAVDAASANLERAQLDLEYTKVKAPISGRIGRAEVTRGNLATADTTVLAHLVSVDPLYVYFESDQATARVNPFPTAAEVPVRVRMEHESEHYVVGQLDFISNRYDHSTGTLQYRARVPNPDSRLKPGQFTRVEMPVGKARQAVLVDQKAVLTDQDRRYVYVLDEQDKATRRFVEVGRHFNGLYVIDAGLKQGDRVVVNGLQKILFAGMQVAPQLVEMRPDDKLPVLAAHLAQ